jgi:hypothetical protein
METTSSPKEAATMIINTPTFSAWQWNRVQHGASFWASDNHYEMHTDTHSFVANIFRVTGGYKVVIADSNGDPIHTKVIIDTLKAAKMAGYRSLLYHCR